MRAKVVDTVAFATGESATEEGLLGGVGPKVNRLLSDFVGPIEADAVSIVSAINGWESLPFLSPVGPIEEDAASPFPSLNGWSSSPPRCSREATNSTFVGVLCGDEKEAGVITSCCRPLRLPPPPPPTAPIVVVSILASVSLPPGGSITKLGGSLPASEKVNIQRFCVK